MVKKKKPSKSIDKPKRTDVGPGRPPKEHQFKKGAEWKGNPNGAAGNDPMKLALRKLTNEALRDAIEKVVTGTEADVVAMLKDPNTTIGHKVILRACLDAAQNGYWDKFNSIIERCLGKTPEVVDHRSTDGSMSPKESKQVSFYLPTNNRKDEAHMTPVKEEKSNEGN